MAGSRCMRWPVVLEASVNEDRHAVRGRAARDRGGSGIMRILIATDAWRPQVNGVVSTLERMTQAAGEFGAKFEFLTPQGMWTAPMPTYPDIRVAVTTPWQIQPPHRRGRAGPHPYRHRRPDRLADPPLLPEGEAAVHHQLSHALSRIHLRAHRPSRAADLRGPAPFPCALLGGDGADADDRARS